MEQLLLCKLGKLYVFKSHPFPNLHERSIAAHRVVDILYSLCNAVQLDFFGVVSIHQLKQQYVEYK